MELNRQFERQLILLQRYHSFWINDHDARYFLIEVIDCHHDDAIFLIVAVWVGDEAWLLGNGHWWSPCGHNFLLLIVVFVNGPVVVLVDNSLMHQLEQI